MFSILHKYIAATALLLAISFTAESGEMTQSVPATLDECTKVGGWWGVVGLPMPDKQEVCVMRTSDFGKPCKNSSKCKGACIAPTKATVGEHAIGSCSEYNLEYGNLLIVTEGVVESINAE